LPNTRFVRRTVACSIFLRRPSEKRRRFSHCQCTILKSPSFCSRSQAETPHIFCVLPLSDEFRERITFCGSHEKFGKCLAQRICNEAQRGATGARRACQAHRASGWPTISRGARPQKNDKELVTLEYYPLH